MAGMVPEDVYTLTGVADPRLSPDGTKVAYVVWSIDREANEYRSAIWLAAADGSEAPRRLTTGTKRDASPRWSPDGTRIAFTSTRDSDHAQLYVMRTDGGDPVKLTDAKASVTGPAWSPDGLRIAFNARVPDAAYEEEDPKKRRPRRITTLQFKLDNEGWTADRRTHVFVVEADGNSEPVQVTEGEFEHGKPAWSPKGSRIVFSAARHADWDTDTVTDLYLIGAEGGEPQRLTASDGSCGTPSWSPDGSMIAFPYSPGVLDEPRHVQIAVLDIETRERRVLTATLDRNCAPYPDVREPVWDGESIVFGVEDAGNTPLYRVRADGTKDPEPVLTFEGGVTGYDVAAGVLAHARTTPITLSELYAGERKLTAVGNAFTGERQLVAPERFTATSPDGAEVEAWIVRPAGFKAGEKYPMLLTIHGGPFTQYANKFFDEFQVFAGAGYAVVYCNPRGSSGYDESWGRAIRGPSNGAGPGWGTVDHDDLMAVTDEALRRFDFCDGERLGVIGGSYGGYMTTWIVGHTDRFKAAVSERAVNDWVSMYGSSDYGWSFSAYMGASLEEDFDAYVKHSPVRYASNITTPLLIMHSENDLRCNVEQAEQLFTALRLLKREVEFVRFPEEGHELSRSGSPAHRVMRFEIILDWFARYLG